jgi:Vitamin K-dependent gamma-carboxylase
LIRKEILSFDHRSLFFFRFLLGSLIVIDLGLRLYHADDYFGPQGIFPSTLGADYFQGHWPLQLLLENFLGIKTFIFLGIISAVLFASGIKTRFTGGVTYFIFLSLNFRNTLILNAGDLLLRTLLLWSLFLPVKKKSDAHQWELSSFCYLGQLFIIYFFATWYKLLSSDWTSGIALKRIFMNREFSTPIAGSFAQYDALMVAGNYFILLLQGLLPFLFLLFFRYPLFPGIAAVVFVVFHFMSLFFLHLDLFPFTAIVAWVPLLPSSFWTGRPVSEIFRKITSYGRLNTESESIFDKKLRIFPGILALFLLGLIFIQNLDRVETVDLKVPGLIKKAAVSLGLSQKWGMFSDPLSFERSWSVKVNDSEEFQLSRMKGYSNDRFRKYFSVLETYQDPRLYDALLVNFCGKLKKENRAQLKPLNLQLVVSYFPLSGTTSISTESIHEKRCD